MNQPIKTSGSGGAPARRLNPLVTPSRLERLAVIYLRQSTKKQVDENTGSTEVQLEQRNDALRLGWDEASIRVIDDDLGRSGSSTDQRTGWDEMLRLVAARQVGAVFVFNEGRIARRARDVDDLRILCLYNDTLLVVDGRPVNSADPGDVALTQMRASFAEYENQTRTNLMTRARLAKARRGHTVSRLPVGWIEQPDGTFDFDPEAHASIAEVFTRFPEAGSVRALVRILDQEGKKLPARHKRQLVWQRPNAQAVRVMLRHSAYAGQYVYGRSESRPELGRRPNGHCQRSPTPPDRWIIIDNHHPAYVTPLQQQWIRDKITANRFPRGPGGGTALLQGLVRCARCDRSLSAAYKHDHRYECVTNSTNYGSKDCTSVVGPAVDGAVERIVLQAIEAPAVDRLRKALADARAGEARRVQAIEAARQRLEHNERVARERYDHSDPHYQLVWIDAQKKLNQALEERQAFERQLAMQPGTPPIEGSDAELEMLARVTAEVPSLWHDPRVTAHDRKEILRCVLEKVLVCTTKESIEGTVVWRSGARSQFYLHRRAGVYKLIKRLHAEGGTAREIQAWLAAGDSETGQSWRYVTNHIYVILAKLGLRPNQRRAYTPELLEQVRHLHDQGLAAPAVADKLNAAGLTTPTGRPWNCYSVRHALKPEEKRLNRRRHRRGDEAVPEASSQSASAIGQVTS